LYGSHVWDIKDTIIISHRAILKPVYNFTIACLTRLFLPSWKAIFRSLEIIFDVTIGNMVRYLPIVLIVLLSFGCSSLNEGITKRQSRPTSEECKVNDADINAEYTGGCKDGFADGQGIAKGRDTYEGAFVNGNKHGQGTYMWSSGAKYIGEYRDDKRSGQGTYISPKGAKYIGEYRDGKRSGKGTFIQPDGLKRIVEYRDGKLVMAKKEQEYLANIWEIVNFHWQAPAAAKRNLLTVITIKISKDGNIANIELERGSGDEQFDASILTGLRSIGRLPPPPVSFYPDGAVIGFRFHPLNWDKTGNP
jgi:TonB family protein